MKKLVFVVSLVSSLLISAVALAKTVNFPFGKVKVVDSYPDYKVKVVKHLADYKVKIVTSCPNRAGCWQFVDKFPDFTIKYVDSFPDFTIQFE